MKSNLVKSACPHDCPSTCLLEIERLSPKTLGVIKGAKNLPFTGGVICEKVSRYAERFHHPARLKYPMRRDGKKGDGVFTRIDWEEAIETIVTNFKKITQDYGAEAIWPYHSGGTMGIIQRYGMERLSRVFGCSGIKNTICVTPAAAGWQAGIGCQRGVDPLEIQKSKFIVVWGGNPVHTNVNLMQHIQKARKNNNAKLAVVDVYRTSTMKVADIGLVLKPGTDGALACAMMHVMLSENLVDRDYLSKFSDFDQDVANHLKDKTPSWASSITGLPKDEIEGFARTFGSIKKTFLKLGVGFTRARNGASNMHAVTCLPAMTGSWKYEGGGAHFANFDIWGLNTNTAHASGVEDKSKRSLDQSRIGAILCGDDTSIKSGPPVKAILIQNANPALVAPNSKKVRRGLSREDLFVCVHEHFKTETARYADLLLPATMFVEHDDLYMGWGHTGLTIGKQILEPSEECLSNAQLINILGRRLGADHESFHLSDRELVDKTLVASGKGTLSTLEKESWVDCRLSFDDSHFLNGFGHPSGLFKFKPDWREIGPLTNNIPEMPDHWNNLDIIQENKPFRLVTAPARSYLNSSFTETKGSQKREGMPKALIHPFDAENLGILDESVVSIGNEKGTITLMAKVLDTAQPGIVIAEGVWPDHFYQNKVGINQLVSDEAVAPNGGVPFHDTAIWLRASHGCP